MKSKNVDFMTEELTRIFTESLITHGIIANQRREIVNDIRRTIQNEYKYLLKGPK